MPEILLTIHTLFFTIKFIRLDTMAIVAKLKVEYVVILKPTNQKIYTYYDI